MIHFVVGTRAQLFKLAPIMLECQRRQLNWRWVYTAQHKETIEETLATFGLPRPDYVVVRWGTEAESLGKMTLWFARMLLSLPKSRQALGGHTGRRHVLITHGDTMTTWLGALMGKLTRTPVMHVESGLRSFKLLHPFPEELNRLITFRLADYYACPGEWAIENLRKYKGEKLNIGANTQADTLRFGLERCDDAEIALPEEKYVVVSIHRYENIFRPQRFARIVEEIERLAQQFRVMFIQHPSTRLQIDKLGYRLRLENNAHLSMVPRLEYVPFIKAIKYCEFVVSDGGGNQEELFYLGKPALILRDETERAEGLGENAILSKLDSEVIANFVRNYKSFERGPRLPSDSPSETIASFFYERRFGA